ncbi:uncharacterized protein A1O9_08898 [Exophiala aquamarina CBS 119918]|uniref:Cupin type-2 domain-containing protein n=1 Tax=Exophiala aquamarina CBS 119918 TaxID=1182545 RepID=A0A072P569_9EURO|nr:uncharacterized protein A1O9_08898 [Exophiala aquamarina CBS 119918]KEF55244.1 hypothetical protein A1O9_08898 [Exophiala aquamarina CBS 119918]
MSAPNEPLAMPKRYITTHNGEGLAIFSSHVQEEAPESSLSDGMRISFCYATTEFPATLSEDQDIKAYETLIQKPPSIVVSNGSVARIVDFPPGHVGTMHRTVSVNYNFVIQGQLELELDSGETRLLGPGDMVVQRAINHAWRNPSKTSWARIAAMALPAKGITVGGRAMEETRLPSMSGSERVTESEAISSSPRS